MSTGANMSSVDHKWHSRGNGVPFKDLGTFVGNFPAEIRQSHVAVFVFAVGVTVVVLFILCWVKSRVSGLWKFTRRCRKRSGAKIEGENVSMEKLVSLLNYKVLAAAAAAHTGFSTENESNKSLASAGSTQNDGDEAQPTENEANTNPGSSAGEQNPKEAKQAAKQKKNEVKNGK